MPRLPAAVARDFLRLAGPLLIPPGEPAVKQRRRFELSRLLIHPPRGLEALPTTVDGVPGEWLRPRGVRGGGALLFLHGGGYALGGPASHRGAAARIATAVGLPAFVADYRLAPEHPYPAALDDALASYRGLLGRGIPAGRIVIAGDSAGGGLALALAMSLRDRGIAAPAAIGLICPWLDLTADIDRTRPPAPREPILKPELLSDWAAAYTAGTEPSDPGVSPLRGDLDGLPPIVLHYAGDDLLRGDGERLAQAAPDVEAHRYDGLWHDFHVLAGSLAEADAAVAELGESLRRELDPLPRPPRVAVVGAGMSGLCVGAKLLAAGLDDFTIHEKASEVGGTWRENRYPGLSCDVPARFYSYSFAPNARWTSVFAPGPEIQGYFSASADQLGLRPRIRFGSEITSARWQAGRWNLRAKDGHEETADVLVTATGILHHPRVPEIVGLESFGGATVHSARWPDDLTVESLRDKRVAVIGTGSTGTQLVSALGGNTRSLLVFQRTAQWILPVPNRPYSPVTRTAFTRFSALNRLSYRSYQRSLEALFGTAVVKDGWQRALIGGLCRLNLRFRVRDADLRLRLTPDYQPMCKRLVMSAAFYPALQRPGVELVTDPIDRVVPDGIRTSDGAVHPVDVIVLATGFDAHAYVRPMEIVGEHGLTLERAWKDGPRAYRTVSMPGFPNLFMLMGPHSPVGNQSLVLIAESQSDYIIHWIELLRSGGVASASPTQAATDRFNAEMREAMPNTVWATGCTSWYLGPDGLPELFPWTPREHRALLKEPLLADYQLSRTVGVAAS
jgi:cation diffusion facilitator CzcD-associated flavoprotein CzcO/acetyl esterase/lipase